MNSNDNSFLANTRQTGSRLVFRLMFIAFMGLLAGLVGEAYTAIFYDNGSNLHWQGFRTGFSIGFLASVFEIIYLRNARRGWIRRLAFVPSLVIRILILTLIVRLCLVLNGFLTDYLIGRPIAVDRDIPTEVRDTLLSMAIVVFFTAQFQFSTLIGFKRFNNLLMGRYFRPVEEERIFLFVDLVGSSEAARKLGDVRFHEFLSEFFYQIDRAIVRNGGEIVSYVGDAVILTWPLNARVSKNSACLRTLAFMLHQLESEREFFEKQFGLFPEFRAALHCGTIVVGECGDSRRQVTFLGDVVNMTARIEQACKDENIAFLASEAAVSRIEPIKGAHFKEYKKIRFKGADQPFSLYEIVVG